MMKRLLVLSLLLFLWADFLKGQFSSYDKMSIEIDSLIRVGLDSQAYPGAQVLIRYKDSIIFHNAWGHHTYDDLRMVEIDDIYDLASITKVSTGLPILMKLYGDGKLNLDAPLHTLVDGLGARDKKTVTLRSALAHQSRLRPYIVYWLKTVKKDGRLKSRYYRDHRSKRFPIKITDDMYLHKNFYKKIKKEINKSEMRSVKQYEYSGLTFLLMPEIIEAMVDEPMEEFLYREIYSPIGADELCYNPLDKGQISKERILPTEHDSLWRKQLVHGRVHDEAAAMLGGISCNAGLFGSAESLSKLFQLYLNEGQWQGRDLIAPQAVHTFTSQAYPDNRRALGFDRPRAEYDPNYSSHAGDASQESYGHTGFTGTMVWADPAYDLIFVFLSNRVHPSRTYRKLYELSIRPKIQQVIYDYILQLKTTVE